MARREMGKLVFLDLVDRSGRIQLMCDTGRTGDVDVHLGDVVGAGGRPAKSRRGEPSLAVDELTVLARNSRSLPDTFHGLTDTETRYRKRYLDLLMNEESRELFLLRTKVVSSIRRYLDAEGFVEVETPVLQPSYGGAFAHPFVTHSNELEADLFLRIATELYLKRLIVGGLERVYEIGKDFRNESVSYKHQPEFTMLEWYEAYADFRDTMDRIETMLEQVALDALGTTVAGSGARDRPEAPVAARRVRRVARSARAVDARRGRAPRVAHRARRRHGRRQGLGAARRPRVRPLRRAEPRSSRRSSTAIRSSCRPSRGPPTTTRRSPSASSTSPRAWSSATPTARSTTPTSSSAASTSSPSTWRGRTRGSRLRRGALLRHAAHGRARPRDRPARHAALRPRDDPRRDPVPGATARPELSAPA